MRATDGSATGSQGDRAGRPADRPGGCGCGRRRARVWRALLPVAGFGALLWFLVRVLPKPSRAAYPCQRAAAPLAAGFVVWLLGCLAAVRGWRRTVSLLAQRRFGAGALAAVATGVVAVAWFAFTHEQGASAGGWTPTDPPNTPVGVGQGLKPGRVVWVHDPAATAWNGSTAPGSYWWAGTNVNQAVLDRMLSQALCWQTGAANERAAWEALFRHFNRQHSRGEAGYRQGERVAIKANLWCAPDSHTALGATAQYTTPQVIRALLRHLVEYAGVTNQALITVGDPSNYVPKSVWDICHPAFPDVRFEDFVGGDGRYLAAAATNAPIFNSNGKGAYSGKTYVWKAMADADYVINLACLRAHDRAGVTLNAKNHFGCVWKDWGKKWTPICVDGYNGWHGYIQSRPGKEFPVRAMGTYTPLVDLLGHRQMGGKTLLFLVDGLYAAHWQGNAAPVRWQRPPFNNDWCSSLFCAQDVVALESVLVDFMRGETIYNEYVTGTVDNYLHEAAQANQPPSGTVYDPEHDGTRLASLGTHEHWNNPVDRQYSRNLGLSAGIELVGSAAQAYGADFYVNDAAADGALAAGATGNSGLTQADPLPAVTAVLERYFDLGAGCTVHVGPGWYAERVVLTRGNSGLTLAGAGARESFLDAGGAGRCLTLTNVTGALVRGLTFTNGLATLGGAVGAWQSGSRIEACVLTGSRAAAQGGGAYADGPLELRNCVIVANAAGADGGGLYARGAAAVVHATIVSNAAAGRAGGLFLESGGRAVNTIIDGNAAGDGREWLAPGAATFAACCTRPAPSADSITNAPIFRGPGWGLYRQVTNSPAVDAGVALADVTEDRDGWPRPLDGNGDGVARPDIGACETLHPSADSDGDTLLDVDELRVYATNPTRTDSDADGAADGDELVAGTNPGDGRDCLAIGGVAHVSAGGGLSLAWFGVTSHLYSVLETTDPMLPWARWRRVPGWDGVAGRNAEMRYEVTTEGAGRRYYRIGVRRE